MGKETAVHLAAAVGDALALQQVDERQGTVVVPVEDRSLLFAVLGHLGQVAVLGAAVLDPDLF